MHGMVRMTLWTALLAVLCGCAGRQGVAHLEEGTGAAADIAWSVQAGDPGEAKGDAEPWNPAEERVQRMPPVRPVSRGGGTWQALGPAPTQNAQLQMPPNNEVSGAIQSIAPHPTNPNILYVGAVNGGVWRTSDALAAQPTWTPLTDQLPSQSIGAVAFDPLDGSAQTLVVGTGRWSNFARRGDDEIGVYRTTNGGNSWTQLGATTLLGQRIFAVAARGNVLLAGSAVGGLFRSVDTGQSWQLVSGTGGLPTGAVFDLVGDPANPTHFYVAIANTSRVHHSTDSGATWTPVSATLPFPASVGSVRLAVGPSSTLNVASISAGGALNGVFRSTTGGASWTTLDVPNVHPGAQGTVNTALVADPTDANILYISGDRGAANTFGNIVRGNAGAAAGSQFTSMVGANASNTTPHADSRAMVFMANGDLLESDDGGIYRRVNPRTTGAWASVNGNLSVLEVHDLDHDNVANVLMIGTQDNGTHMQQTAVNPRWTWINGGDGGDANIDDRTSASSSLRYISSQNLGGFRRATFNAANTQTANQTVATGITDAQFVTPVEINLTNPARMIVGGLNTIYESSNVNVGVPTFTAIPASGANRNAMAYGATNDPNAIYVGKNAAVLKRLGSATTFTATAALPAGAAALTDVAMDPDDAQRVYAVDDNQVFVSVNAGDSWTDITGNLPTISAQDFRTIEYIADPSGDRIALGTRSGVYIADVNSSVWDLYGSALPDVLVFDLRYVPERKTLYAGTLGRGVWSLTTVEGFLFANGFE